MARAAINLGVAPTGQGGDTFRTASQKNNDNSAELYAALGAPSNGQLPAALPLAKGGTGGTDAATAQLALGLQKVSSLTDLTPGRLVTTGYCGVGLTHSTNMSNIDNAVAGAEQFFSTPETSGTKPFSYGFIHTLVQSGNNFYQVAYEVISGGRIASRFYTSASGWSAWAFQYSTANTTRAADGTLKAI